MGSRVRLPDLAFAFLPIFILLASPLAGPGIPQDALQGEAAEKAAAAIVARLDGLPMSSFWDSIARLESMGKDAVPAIQKAAAGAGEKARLGAARAMISLANESARGESLKEIATLSQSASDKEVRAAAIEILGSEDPEGSAELIRQIFEDSSDDPAVLIPAAKVLCDLEGESRAQAAYRKRLLELVGSRDGKVRYAAALALAETDCFEGDVRKVLRELRKEPTDRGRLAAALLGADLAARREERRIDAGETLPGVDTAKVLKEKETMIRELQAKLDGIERSRGAPAGGDPVLEEVIEKIQKNYIEADKAKRKDLILAAVKGMVKSLDDFSTFFDVEETARFMTDIKGEYFGIGAQVSKLTEEGPLEVVKPIYGGGAYECGIRTGDKILEVDGFSTEEHPLEEIVEKLLKGPEGTTVIVKAMRRGWTEPREFRIPRRVVVVPSVFHEMLPGSIGYLRLINFGDKSGDEFEEALTALEDGGMEGLILDLRYNPGGRLDVALRIVDLFIGEKDQPILTRRGRDGTEVTSTPSTPGQRPSYPLVVLINSRSASASEIVAGALKDFHRASLIGQRTFGKGSVQTLIPMSPKAREVLGGETRIKLTTQYWYLPSGRCIQTTRDASGKVIQGGVEPDIPTEMEQYPSWLSEEVEKIRSSEKIFDYINTYYDELKMLGSEGDGRDPERWKDFDELYKSLDTRATPDHVRQVIRYHLRRRLEDEQGKEFPSDYQEDNQLQRGILEILKKVRRDPATIPAYAWLKGKEFPAGKTNGAEKP
jgi:carboxyl-terminal processing protease